MKRMMLITMIVFLAMPIVAQEGLDFSPFDEEYERLERSRTADKVMVGIGIAMSIAGIGTIVVPMFYRDRFSPRDITTLSIVAFSVISVGFTWTLGSGIAWGVHNDQLTNVMLMERKYQRIQGVPQWSY